MAWPVLTFSVCTPPAQYILLGRCQLATCTWHDGTVEIPCRHINQDRVKLSTHLILYFFIYYSTIVQAGPLRRRCVLMPLTGSYYMVLNCTPPCFLCQSHTHTHMHTDLLEVLFLDLMEILEKKSKTNHLKCIMGCLKSGVELASTAVGLLPSRRLQSSVVALNV